MLLELLDSEPSSTGRRMRVCNLVDLHFRANGTKSSREQITVLVVVALLINLEATPALKGM